MKFFAAAATLLVALAAPPSGAFAAADGELWEVSSQMNIPGMPAGMGGMTQRVCQDKDPGRYKPQGEDMEKCKVTDMKQSGNKISMTMVCPDGKMTLEHTYNAARTEYKGTMKMSSRDGDMTMNMSGRKVGTCDPAQQRREQEQMQAKVQGQIDQADRAMKKAQDDQIRDCAVAVETMDMRKLGLYGTCWQQPEVCKTASADPGMKPVSSACTARQAEFCKRYRTEEGFLKAKASEEAAKMCGTTTVEVKTMLCPAAAKKESLLFLGNHCLVEAKPLAERHCAGRDFTALSAGARQADKYDDFCRAYLANASLEGHPKPAPAAAGEKAKPTDAINQGINQGINKLRGLLGR